MAGREYHRPKWADRQRITAADLTAEQTWTDARLAHLRRFALGWGVIAGFEVEAVGNRLRIQPGYGLTAAGSELYMPEVLDVADLHKRVCDACGMAAGGCDTPRAFTDDAPATAWLVLRPLMVDCCPRPTVPDICAHPGAGFAYARQCSAIEADVICDLHGGLLADLTCDRLRSYLNGAPVPMPAMGADVLPIARVTTRDGRVQRAEIAPRPRLLPMGITQQILACADLRADVDTPADPPPVDEPDPPTPEPPVKRPWDAPDHHEVAVLVESITDALPGGAADFGLTLDALFAEASASAPRMVSRFDRPVSLITQSFAASLLVQDERALAAFLRGEFASLYHGPKRPTDAAARLMERTYASELPKSLKLGDIWASGATGYQAILPKFGGTVLGDIEPAQIGLPDELTLRRKDTGLRPPELAALYWLTERARTIQGAK